MLNLISFFCRCYVRDKHCKCERMVNNKYVSNTAQLCCLRAKNLCFWYISGIWVVRRLNCVQLDLPVCSVSSFFFSWVPNICTLTCLFNTQFPPIRVESSAYYILIPRFRIVYSNCISLSCKSKLPTNTLSREVKFDFLSKSEIPL